jgi:beta-lactamase regulating signal transducer with metallopeptidase domain
VIVLTWLLDATLKGTVLILIVAILHALLARRVDARWRHLLWIVVLVRLAVPIAPASSWSVFNLIPDRGLGPLRLSIYEVQVVPRHAQTPAPHMRIRGPLPGRWPVPAELLLTLWLAGVAVLALRTLIASIRTQRAVARARRSGEATGEAAAVLADACRQLGLRRRVGIAQSPTVRTPALHGLLRPVILLPAGLTTSFTRDELRYVILHELWHHRRMDVAVSWLLSAVQTLHWFNPFVWFAASRIKEERELACDELALSCLEEEERIGYGRTVLKLLERFRASATVPALVGIVNHKQKMRRRLMMIASFRNRTRFSTLFVLVVAVVAFAGLTDAAGRDRIIRELDPAAQATVEKLDQRVSLELTNATLSELLTAVANRTGTVVTQGPELAVLPVQHARFTVKAENIPAHAVLMESLMAFELAPEPSAAGVTIVSGPPRIMVSHGLKREAMSIDEDVTIVTDGVAREGDRVIHVIEGEEPGGEAEERVFVRKLEPGNLTFDATGKLRREMTLTQDLNGVKSEGKLSIEITK